MTVARFGRDTLLQLMQRSRTLGIVLSSCLFIVQAALGAQASDRNAGSANKASQSEPETLRKGDTELGVLVEVGIAHDLGGEGDRQFLAFGGRLGRILTEPAGPGFLRGNLEIAVELLPVFLMFQETTVYGFSSTLLLRHYFSPHRRLRPFMSLGVGALFATDPIPPQGSSFTFTPQGGFGVAWFQKPGLVYLFEYRFHHISNGGLKLPNPGINSSTLQFGVSLFH